MNGICKQQLQCQNKDMDFVYVISQTPFNNKEENDNKNNDNSNNLGPLWIVSSDGLYYETFNNVNYKLQYHTISCCGIDISSDSQYIAVGDLGCNVLIWNCNDNKKNDKPLIHVQCPMSVRSIKWIPNSSYIVIGCLDGSCLLYVFDDNGDNKK